jgi:diguanylate cyclase (GGDEF)-like protein
MSFDIKKILPRPERVKSNFYNTYVVIALLCVVLAIVQTILAVLFYSQDYSKLALYSGVCVLIAGLIFNVNSRGRHLQAVLILQTTIYLFVVMYIYNLGWSAGFQYYFIVGIGILMLYPHPKIRLPILGALILLLTFIFLYLFKFQAVYSNVEFNYTLNLFNAICAMLALGLTNFYFRTNIVSLLKVLNISANTDLLTGLLNRRRMNMELQRHCKMSERYEQCNSLILVDIDHFKSINDTYGHSAGDSVLKDVSAIMYASIREADHIARWGGEEFLILAPFTHCKDAGLAAEKLRKKIAEHTFYVKEKPLKLTITAGVAELCAGQSIQDALTRADKLLYQAKDLGRNKVMVQSVPI